jgi:hypothetical protein
VYTVQSVRALTARGVRWRGRTLVGCLIMRLGVRMRMRACVCARPPAGKPFGVLLEVLAEPQAPDVTVTYLNQSLVEIL